MFVCIISLVTNVAGFVFLILKTRKEIDNFETAMTPTLQVPLQSLCNPGVTTRVPRIPIIEEGYHEESRSTADSPEGEFASRPFRDFTLSPEGLRLHGLGFVVTVCALRFRISKLPGPGQHWASRGAATA